MSKRRFQKFKKYDCSSSDSDEEKLRVETFGPDLPAHLQTDSSQFGPALPPYLASSTTGEVTSFGPELPPYLQDTLLPHTASETKTIGPVLPPHLLHAGEKKKSGEDELEAFGPLLPQHLQETLKPHRASETKTGELGSIGPVLPPHLLKAGEKEKSSKEELGVFGPLLPPNFRNSQASTSGEPKPAEKLLGPVLPPGFVPPDSSSSEEDNSYGPDPRLMASGDAGSYNDVNERMERARRKMLEKANKKLERETWMLDLPPERAANLGLGPRQFRAKPAPEMGDRSIWTDTPADKAKKKHLPPKVDDNDLIRKSLIAARDDEMEKMAKKAEKKLKRKESLLDSHTKKLKQDAKDGTNKNNEIEGERKMFNRETDMQVNRFDEAQKKAIFKKAQLLNDRFSQGESKYL